jgi:hypothetical protein
MTHGSRRPKAMSRMRSCYQFVGGQRIATLAAMIVVIILQSSSAGAASYYVSPRGSDSNSGTSTSAAFLTIQQAANRAQPGDTVYVLDGTYAAFQISRSGSSGYNITFQAYSGSHPVITKTGNSWNAIELNSSTSPSFIVIDGFTIIGNAQGITADQAQSALDYNNTTNGNCIGGGSKSHHITIRNNVISYCPGNGILMPGDYIYIYNNIIHHNAFWSPLDTSGITVAGKDSDWSTATKVFVYNNILYGNQNFICNKFQTTPCRITDGEGIIVDSNKATGYHGRVLIYNNIAYNNGGPGIEVGHSQHVDVVNNTTFKNNISAAEPAPFQAHTHGGEISISSANDVNVLNNIMYGSAGLPVIYSAMVTSTTKLNWNYDLLFGGTETKGLGTHDLLADPLFRSADTLDFHLQDSSPAKKSGTSTLAPRDDFDGVSRPKLGVSRGAYQ